MIKKPNGSTSLKYEMVQLETDYAFTINLPDLKGSMRLDHNTYLQLFKKKIATIPHLVYRLVPEYSQFGRLHFHGTVKFNSILAKNYWYEMIYTLDCNYKFDTIADKEVWEEYLYKQKPHMQPFLEKLKIDYELSNKNVRPPINVDSKPRSFEEYIDQAKQSTA